MKSLFTIKLVKVCLRAQKLLILPSPKSKSIGTNTNLYRCNTVWNSLKHQLMNSKTFHEFKSELKSWNGKGSNLIYWKP